MKMEKKHIYTALVIVWLLLLFIFLPLNKKTQEIKIEEKKVIDYSNSPNYAILVSKIDKSYYDNSYFLSCNNAWFKKCINTFNFQEISLEWSFLDQINALLKRVDNTDFNECIKETISNCYTDMTQKLLQKTSDYKYCYNYLDETVKNNCLEQYITELSQDKKDIDICDKLQDKTKINNCKTNYAKTMSLDSNDISLCDYIEEDSMKSECKDRYYKKLSISKKDISICDKIAFKLSKEDCKKNFYFNLAFASNDIKLCNNSKNIEDKNYCLSRFVWEKVLLNAKSIEDCQKSIDYSEYFSWTTLLDDMMSNCENRFIKTTASGSVETAISSWNTTPN